MTLWSYQVSNCGVFIPVFTGTKNSKIRSRNAGVTVENNATRFYGSQCRLCEWICYRLLMAHMLSFADRHTYNCADDSGDGQWCVVVLTAMGVSTQWTEQVACVQMSVKWQHYWQLVVVVQSETMQVPGVGDAGRRSDGCSRDAEAARLFTASCQ